MLFKKQFERAALGQMPDFEETMSGDVGTGAMRQETVKKQLLAGWGENASPKGILHWQLSGTCNFFPNRCRQLSATNWPSISSQNAPARPAWQNSGPNGGPAPAQGGARGVEILALNLAILEGLRVKPGTLQVRILYLSAGVTAHFGE